MRRSVEQSRRLATALGCLAIPALLLAGCGSAPATSQGMAASAYDVEQQHPDRVAVMTSGGEEASLTHPAQITDAMLAQAIEEAILASGVFEQVAPAADYQLSVQLFSLEQPAMGFSMSVHMEAGWTLTRLEDDEIVWRESISSFYAASPSDAFVGLERLRLATEGAARRNIQEGSASRVAQNPLWMEFPLGTGEIAVQTAGLGPDSPSTAIFATLPATASGHRGSLGEVPNKPLR